jgi:hypothetical protein
MTMSRTLSKREIAVNYQSYRKQGLTPLQMIGFYRSPEYHIFSQYEYKAIEGLHMRLVIEPITQSLYIARCGYDGICERKVISAYHQIAVSPKNAYRALYRDLRIRHKENKRRSASEEYENICMHSFMHSIS